MSVYSRHSAIQKINQLASQHTPFLFCVNFTKTEWDIMPVDSITSDDCLYDIQGVTNSDTSNKELDDALKLPIEWSANYLSYESYQAKIQHIIEQAKAGNTYLANLTVATPIATNLSLLQIFRMTQARYRLWKKNQFVCFSPEIFVQIKDNKIATFPMKGTIDAVQEDSLTELMQDEKEAAEHATIVDLLRNDLSIVAKNVYVKRYRYAEKVCTNKGAIWQLSSEIEGDLPINWKASLGTLLDLLLPAGSISGAPKKKTCEIIQETEAYDRDYYTGVMGYFDGETLDSGVMIRFLQQTDEGLIFKAGGGVTHLSKPESEYQEIQQKTYLPLLPSK
ncbi:aminodeoxychorismate synthase component I [Gammaproteobacteria bacterium]|nr:aminodeoxychorismate synthase component I [Gammaproteobacteria bacterium]